MHKLADDDIDLHLAKMLLSSTFEFHPLLCCAHAAAAITFNLSLLLSFAQKK